MRTVVSGATGFIGTRLVSQLSAPVVLGRNESSTARHFEGYDVTVHAWDPETSSPPPQAFDNVDVVFHLAGESVGEGRWTAAKKRRIRDSRVEGTRRLVESLAGLSKPPGALVCASAIGYYGSRGDALLDESSEPGDDFLADVCVGWEREATMAEKLGIRVVRARFGIVLGPGGGALKKMLTPFKLGLGGRLGSGWQWMSWVHLDDVVGLLMHSAQNVDVTGPINVVSPNPVTNREFTRTLARVLGRPAVFPVPAFALRVLVGEFAEALLGSQRVAPRVATETGYGFRHAELDDALERILYVG